MSACSFAEQLRGAATPRAGLVQGAVTNSWRAISWSLRMPVSPISGRIPLRSGHRGPNCAALSHRAQRRGEPRAARPRPFPGQEPLRFIVVVSRPYRSITAEASGVFASSRPASADLDLTGVRHHCATVQVPRRGLRPGLPRQLQAKGRDPEWSSAKARPTTYFRRSRCWPRASRAHLVNPLQPFEQGFARCRRQPLADEAATGLDRAGESCAALPSHDAQ